MDRWGRCEKHSYEKDLEAKNKVQRFGFDKSQQRAPVSAPEREGKNKDPDGTPERYQWKLKVTFLPLRLKKGGGWSMGPK